jgi:gliding motility-associated peptidyl-prolyl isomerase
MKFNLLFLLLILISFIGCKSPEARKPITVKTGSFIENSAERNIKLNERENELINQIIESDTLNEYVSSNYGFYYYFNTKVDSTSYLPQFGDIINFNYNIKSIDGETIYSKEDIKTQNYAMDKEELFTGLREGLKLLSEGETATFIFPSQKAFGYYGDENKIGTNIPIICKVSVNKITKNQY